MTQPCLPPSHIVHPWMQGMERTLSMQTTLTSLAALQTKMRGHIGRKSPVLQSGAQITICCSKSTKPMTSLLTSEKRHTPSVSVCMTEAKVEWINNVSFLGIHISITENLSWSSPLKENTNIVLYF